MDDRTTKYADTLAKMIRKETVSTGCDPTDPKFIEFRDMLEEWFPNIFASCEVKMFPDGLVLHWKGKDSNRRDPVIFMNHHDVVEASGKWTHEPFSGDIDGEKIWGRGTLDDKGGTWPIVHPCHPGCPCPIFSRRLYLPRMAHGSTYRRLPPRRGGS